MVAADLSASASASDHGLIELLTFSPRSTAGRADARALAGSVYAEGGIPAIARSAGLFGVGGGAGSGAKGR